MTNQTGIRWSPTSQFGNSHDPSIKSLEIDSILWEGIAFWKIPFHVLGHQQRSHLRIQHGDGNSPSRPVLVTSTTSNQNGQPPRIEQAALPLTLVIGRKFIQINSITGIVKVNPDVQ